MKPEWNENTYEQQFDGSLRRGPKSRPVPVMTNLRLCFPERSEAWRRAVMRRHFIVFGCALLDRALFWWASLLN